ncbi:C40 family peptidase [Neobacillus sp. Marseille-QA0830]
MIRKLAVLLFAFILFTVYMPLSSSLAHAEELSHIQEQKLLEEPGEINKEQVITRLDAINQQVTVLNQTMDENNQKMTAANHEVESIQSQIPQLQTEIADLRDKTEKRSSLVKERALVYQQSGTNVSYLDALLSSGSISELVARIGAVSKIIKADQELLAQQDADLKNLEKKETTLVTKQEEAMAKAAQLQNIQAELAAQQNQYSLLTQQLQAERKKQEARKLPEKPQIQPNIATQDYVHIVTTVGLKYIGRSKYTFGGGRTEADVASGRFDCSGFVRWAFAQAGIELGNSTSDMRNGGRKISESEMRPGDLVFFDTYKKDGHVGIYLGDGKFIGSQSSTGVAIADMSTGYWKSKFKGIVVRI